MNALIPMQDAGAGTGDGPAAPVDVDWLERALAAPGGLQGLDAALAPRLRATVAALPALALLERAGAAAAEDAAALYRLWLLANGDAPDAFGPWFNLGVALMQAGEPAAAAVACESALALKPDLHDAAMNLGLAREAAGDRPGAVAAWRRALPPAATRRALHVQLGRVLEEEHRLEEAAEELRAALLIDPDQPDVIQHYVHLRQRMTAWPVLDPDIPLLPPATQGLRCGPLAALALHEDPADQASVGVEWIARKIAAAPERLAPPQGYAHDRVRVGYLSSDFCRHAMSYLIAEVFERHDRDAFEVYGYDVSPEDGSELRARVIAAMDHHVPLHALTDEQAARRIRADEIDVLVDLNGLTRGSRAGVLRWKPAPAQATYLGYIGPVPIPELDYMICDAETVPPALDAAYRPKPLRLAGCYQANDGRALDLPQVTRASEGLPEDAFLFCCFSHHYKITAKVWEAWLEILSRAPASALWLVEDNPVSRRNLSARWAARGLAPERLIFASRTDPDRYRARLGLPDLFLDTTPYNAGTIASDALRMGLPLLTVEGRAFSARMAGSLLTAVGLPECVTPDLEAYVNRAVALARDPARHAALKARLADGAWGRTLGDCAAFTRRLEAALASVRLRPAG